MKALARLGTFMILAFFLTGCQGIRNPLAKNQGPQPQTNPYATNPYAQYGYGPQQSQYQPYQQDPVTDYTTVTPVQPQEPYYQPQAQNTYQPPVDNNYQPPPQAPVYNPTTPVSSQSANRTATVYTVQRGDTLYSISRRYGTTVEAVKSANGLTSDLIHPGDRLSIP